MQWAQNFRVFGLHRALGLGSGRAQASRISLQACQALEVIAKLIVIFVIEPKGAFKKPVGFGTNQTRGVA